MADPADMCDAIGAAISGVLGGEAELVTRWVAMVETMDSDGERALWALAPAGAKPWDTLGLLHFGIQIEQGAVNAREDDD